MRAVEDGTPERVEGEEIFRALAQDMSVVVWITRDKQTVYMTPNVRKVLGFTPEEIITIDPFRSTNIHPDDLLKVKNTIEDLYSGNKPYEIEYRVQRKDGKWIWIHEQATSLYEKEGARYTYGLFSDITERKQLEEEIRAAKEQLEYAVFANPAVIYVGKPLPDKSDFTATFISKSINSVVGFEAEQLTDESGAKFWESRVPSEDLRKYRAGVPVLWKQGQHAFEYRFLHRDGKYRWIREEVRVIRDAQGNVRDVVGYWIDVTDRKTIEESYRSIVEHIPVTVWTADSAGKTTFVTPNTSRVYGYSVEELYNEPEFWFKLIHPDDVDRVKAGFNALFAAGKPFDEEYRFRAHDGTWIWLRDSANRTYEKNDVRYADGVVENITRRKELEQRLMRAERMATIGETAAMVGHDLRNPLQSISGAAYNLRTRLRNVPDPSVEEMLGIIDSGVQYANRIVSDLLDFSRDAQIHLLPGSVQSIVKQALANATIPTNIKVVEDMLEDFEILADESKMKRVLTNLIQNAVDAMPEGGTLTISGMRADGQLSIRVSDTGVGIPREHMVKLWNTLYTTKAKGMGLGLPICKRFVEAHGGSISVESIPGKGSTFTVKVPIKSV